MHAGASIISDYTGGLKNQIRIVTALFLRESGTRFGGKRLGILWGVVEPVLHMAIFYLMSIVFGRIGPYSIPYLPFLASGIFPLILMRNCYNRVVSAVDANRALLVFPQITFFDVSLARVLLEYMITTLAVTLTLSAYSWFTGPLGITSLPQVIIAYSYFPVMGMAMGVFFRPLVVAFPFVDTMMTMFMRIIYLSSGVFYTLDRIPAEYRDYLRWNPFAQLLEIERNGLFSRYPMQPGFDNWWYLIFVAALLMVFSRVLERRYERFIVNGSDD